MSYDLTYPYEPARQWVKWGEWYEGTYDPAGYVQAEEVLARVLSGIPWQTVLDVGCGFGRLGELVERIRPGASYTGIDVSPHQIAAARRRLPDAHLHVTDAGSWWGQGSTFDLVISAEVLMHQPPSQARQLTRRMVRWSKAWIVNCDWYEPGEPENEWNFVHDYPSLYGSKFVSSHPAGGQTVFLAQK